MQEAPAPMRLLSRILNVAAAAPERAVEGLVQLAATNAAGANGLLFHHEKAIVASDYAYNRQVQERLWSESERLVGLAQAD
jgi:hypothetical protein